MEVQRDSSVVIEYVVKTEDGTLIKGENGPVSLNFVVGYEQLMPALERRLLGLEEGSEVKFVIPAREAFGERDEKLVKKKTFADFPDGRDLLVGKWAVATHARTGTQYGYLVKEKGSDFVVLDYNHPLAGSDLYYELKVVSVRSALPDELEYLRPCEFKENGPDTE